MGSPSESTGRVLEKQRGSPWEISGQSLEVYEEEHFGDGVGMLEANKGIVKEMVQD